MNKLIHNCPNCGAALTSDGYCNYCKTKIRYANIIELEGLNPYGCLVPVEILLKFKNEKRGNFADAFHREFRSIMCIIRCRLCLRQCYSNIYTF